MISNLRISVAELVVWALLAAAGLTWISLRALDGAAWLMDWLRGRRLLRRTDEDPAPCGLCGSLEPCEHDEELPPLPPERTWEQMTSHQLPVADRYEQGFTDGAVFVNQQWSKNPPNMIPTHLSASRERRAPWWEVQQRAAYESLGFDYPSGLMARVRELTP